MKRFSELPVLRTPVPYTNHPCHLVHAILAAWIGDTEEAYRLFPHATRLDLDDYNTRRTKERTSQAWREVGRSTRGFAGMKILDGQFDFNPIIPSSVGQLYIQSKFPWMHPADESRKQKTKSLLEGCELNIRISEAVSYNLEKG